MKPPYRGESPEGGDALKGWRGLAGKGVKALFGRRLPPGLPV